MGYSIQEALHELNNNTTKPNTRTKLNEDTANGVRNQLLDKLIHHLPRGLEDHKDEELDLKDFAYVTWIDSDIYIPDGWCKSHGYDPENIDNEGVKEYFYSVIWKEPFITKVKNVLTKNKKINEIFGPLGLCPDYNSAEEFIRDLLGQSADWGKNHVLNISPKTAVVDYRGSEHPGLNYGIGDGKMWDNNFYRVDLADANNGIFSFLDDSEGLEEIKSKLANRTISLANLGKEGKAKDLIAQNSTNRPISVAVYNISISEYLDRFMEKHPKYFERMNNKAKNRFKYDDEDLENMDIVYQNPTLENTEGKSQKPFSLLVAAKGQYDGELVLTRLDCGANNIAQAINACSEHLRELDSDDRYSEDLDISYFKYYMDDIISHDTPEYRIVAYNKAGQPYLCLDYEQFGRFEGEKKKDAKDFGIDIRDFEI